MSSNKISSKGAFFRQLKETIRLVHAVRSAAVRANACLLLLLAVGVAAGCGTAGETLTTPASVDDSFSARTVNAVLLEGNPAIVRLAQRRFDVRGPGRATETIRKVITVLEPAGRSFGEFVIHYDETLRRLESVGGRIIDANGRVVRTLADSDQLDRKASTSGSFYSDTRIRVVRMYHHEYPYTIELKYVLEHDGLAHWPTWYPQDSVLPVEHADFRLSAPSDMTVRMRASEAIPAPDSVQADGRKIFHWNVRNRAGLEVETAGPSLRDQVPSVKTAPGAFEVGGAAGNMRTWKKFGSWYAALSEGRDELPPEAVAEVRRLVEGAQSDMEKVRRLYDYLQEKTRYISIQLGLGGWQPFHARYVHERGYGDCKALTNYMKALLHAAGISAHPALIRSGIKAPSVHPGFPNNDFNHVVLFVPIQNDDIWLECTSQSRAFGHLGAANEDRYALVVDESGGRLVKTPASSAQQNRLMRRGVITLNALGNATADITTTYTGNQQDHVRDMLTHGSRPERNKWLKETIDLANFQIAGAQFPDPKQAESAMKVELTLEIDDYATRSGPRLFLRPNLMNRISITLPDDETRDQPIVFPYPFVDTDTLHFVLPARYEPEAVPEDISLETSFASYETRTVVEGRELTYYRRLAIKERTIPVERYEEFRDFARQLSVSDRAKAVLVRREE